MLAARSRPAPSPTPARTEPRPAPRPAAPSPTRGPTPGRGSIQPVRVPGTAPAPIPVGSPYAIGPATGDVLAELGQQDTLIVVAAGYCPFWSRRLSSACNGPAGYRVMLGPAAGLSVCLGHAHSIRHQARDAGRFCRIVPELP